MNDRVSHAPATIAVFGLGYVGCVTSACLAALGHMVRGVDSDGFKVAEVNAGRAPFHEPGLPELIQAAVQGGRLVASTNAAAALEGASVAFLCVGTPSSKNGDLDLTYLRRVTAEIAAWQKASGQALIVATRSTAFPGTGEELEKLFEAGAPVHVVSNPEFLREGVAVKDFQQPSLLVVGGENEEAVRFVAGLYDPLGVPACQVSRRTAEMIKYACNAFHALKISFANEVGSLSAALGINGSEVMATLCQDKRLNASAAYLRPGFAFGGSCLPKDLRAITYRARSRDLSLPLLEHVLESNEAHLRRALDQVLNFPASRIGVIGLAFKPNTDDLRESPSIPLIEHLIGKGREIQIFDSYIRLEEIYGSNKNYVLAAIPHIGRLMMPKIEDVLSWAEVLVVTYPPDAALSELIRASRVPVIDLAGTGQFTRS